MNYDEEQFTMTSCPVCEGRSIREKVERDEFEVGSTGIVAVADVPVLTCSSCGFSFTDSRAEAIRHDAACVALDLLTPEEIKAIRRRYDMTRRQFAQAFYIGHASLERWENRKLFISSQSSAYLRLLADVKTGQRILDRAIQPAVSDSPPTDNVIIFAEFAALARDKNRMERTLVRREKFRLKQAVS